MLVTDVSQAMKTATDMWRIYYHDLWSIVSSAASGSTLKPFSTVINSAPQYKKLLIPCTTLSRACNISTQFISHPLFVARRMSTSSSHNDKNQSQERARKRPRRGTSSDTTGKGQGTIDSGVFWDIENMPVKKSDAAKRIPEIKQALTHFVTMINHYNQDAPSPKNMKKFMAVARQKGEDTAETTSDFIKQQLAENKIELLDLPYSADPDYCDDAIFRSVLCFIESHGRSMVVALTGDVGLVQRINQIERDFDLLVLMQRAGKKTSVMQRHCDKIKQTNERGRQQAVYFMDEVIRKCLSGGVPQTFSDLLRMTRARELELEMEDDHFNLLFGKEDAQSDDDKDSTYDSDFGSDTDMDDSSSETGLFSDVDIN